MTQDQLMGLIRQLLPVVGGIAVALGWFTADQVGKLMQVILQIAGPVSVVLGAIWSLIANGKVSILTSAANMPEVKKIVVAAAESTPEATEAARSLAIATPVNVVLEPK